MDVDNVVNIRSKMVDISLDKLNEFLEFPPVDRAALQAIEDAPDTDDIRRVLCDDNLKAKWKASSGSPHNTLAFKYFSKKARVYLRFVCQRLIPCEHMTDIRFERVIATYALMKKIDINVGYLMFRELQRTRENMQWRLFFPNTLTKYMRPLKVPVDDGDQKEVETPKKVDITNVKSPYEDRPKKLSYERRFDRIERMLLRQWRATELDMKMKGVDLTPLMTELPYIADERLLVGFPPEVELHVVSTMFVPSQLVSTPSLSTLVDAMRAAATPVGGLVDTTVAAVTTPVVLLLQGVLPPYLFLMFML